MNIRTTTELMKKYAKCPECGNEKVGGEPSEGALIIEDHVFTRSCKCGWSVTVDKGIGIGGTATRRFKGHTTGVVSITFRKTRRHKYVDMNELKQLSGAKRSNQTKLMESWLNTTEGKKWAEETADCSHFFGN